MLDVLGGQAESVRIEVPGEFGAGFEFRVRYASDSSWHQCKHTERVWTLARLRSEGLLQKIFGKVLSGDVCVLLTSAGAPQLEGLAERARASADWPEYDRAFLEGAWRSHFEVLRKAWGAVPAEQAWAALRRVNVHTVDEQYLSSNVRERATSLVEGETSAVTAVLSQLADDSIHIELDAVAIWQELERAGFSPRQWGQDTRVVTTVRKAAERFVQRASLAWVDGEQIPRVEAGRVTDALEVGRPAVLVGGPGYGKTEVTAQVVAAVTARGWAVLPVRADRAKGETTTDLGAGLGLPGSPVAVLAAVAGNEPALLVVDQMDSVSLLSGRRSERFDVVADLVAEASRNVDVGLLVVCRQFDLDNDHRFRALTAELNPVTVPVELLNSDTVRAILARVPVDASSFTEPLRELLRVPLHLALYAEMARAGAGSLSGVTELEDLFERYWVHKQRQCAEAREGADQWVEVVDLLCDRMSASEALHAPVALLDDLHEQADVMKSVGVLLTDGGRVSFFHERFFDYCFARRFVARGNTLQGLIAGDAQDLFRRSQVRQVLLHERSANPPQYRRDLRWLMSDDVVRPHVAASVIAVVGTLPDPSTEEWSTLRHIALDPGDWRHARVWQAVRRNKAWFAVIDTAGDWDYLLDDEKIADIAVWALGGLTGADPERVVGLVSTRMDRSDAWGRRATHLARFADPADRPVVDLLMKVLDEFRETTSWGDVWYLIKQVAQRRPDWACELVGRLVVLATDQAQASGNANPFAHDPRLDDSTMAAEALEDAATGAPAEFVRRLLPPMLRLMELNARPEWNEAGSQLVQDSVWYHRSVGRAFDLSAYLLSAMAMALQGLEVLGPPEARASALAALTVAPWEAGRFLVARSYSAGLASSADEAIDWLCSTPEHLALGYVDSVHWASREVVAAATPHCSDEALGSLVEILLAYYPTWERLRGHRRQRGIAQLYLLTAISPGRRSAAVERRLGELQRKFGPEGVEPPKGVAGGAVGPPINPGSAAHMSDNQWLGAIRRYNDFFGASSSVDGSIRGGAMQLSQVLEAETRNDPQRFARLLLRIGPDVHDAYPSAVLRGLSDGDLDEPTVNALVAHAVSIATSEINRWMVRLVERRATLDFDDSVLDAVAAVATADRDPAEIMWQASDTDPTADSEGDIDSAGLNFTRAVALLAMRSLLAARPERLDRLRPALTAAAVDPVSAVRASCVAALQAVLGLDPSFAVTTFATAVAGHDDVLRSLEVHRFLYLAVREHYDSVAPAVVHMLRSSNGEIARAGARVVTVASYFRPDVDPLIDACLTGDVSRRLGAVEVYADSVAIDKGPPQVRTRIVR